MPYKNYSYHSSLKLFWNNFIFKETRTWRQEQASVLSLQGRWRASPWCDIKYGQRIRRRVSEQRLFIIRLCCWHCVDQSCWREPLTRQNVIQLTSFSARNSEYLLNYFRSQIIYICKRFSCHVKFSRVFRKFPKASEDFPKIYEDVSHFPVLIWLTCLHPCCHPIQIKWWFIWEETIVLFVYTPMQSFAHDKLHNCNRPNESSRGLSWVATWM